MKSRVWYVAVALAATLANWIMPVHAFTLGEMHGMAIIGRPLDVSVQVQTGSGEDVSVPCLSAEVFHADAKQVTPKVSVTAPTSGGAEATLVRIQSSGLVDEPVVTVVLRSSCGASASRRYVLLADLPPVGSSVTASNATGLRVSPWGTGSAAPIYPAPVASSPAVGLGATPSHLTSVANAAKPVAEVAQRNSVNKVRPSVSAPPKFSLAASKRATHKAVLKLDPLDILSDRIDSLDSWMVFAPTEDALRQTAQISTLQADVKVLRDKAAMSDAKLAELRAQLQQAQDELIPVEWLYALIALLLLLVLALLAVWWRRRAVKDAQGSRWHEQEDLSGDTILMPPKVHARTEPAGFDPVEAVKADHVAVVAAPAAAATLSLDAFAHKVTSSEIDLVESASSSAKMETSGAEAPVPGLGGIHNLGMEPILDIRQQAEFFVSLGQTERALRILKKQISDSAQPNPFIYLDLLALYHSLGLKADFRECRKTFNQFFNGVVPDFPAFHLEGRDLLDYPDVLAELVDSWPSAKTLVFLDTCIFHDAKLQVRPTYDLAAFRDVLMLHVLAEELATDLPDGTSPHAVTLERQGGNEAGVTLPSTLSDMSVAFSADPAPARPAVNPPAPQAKPLEETPSRMLDLDFSTLGADPTPPATSVAPAATRWPVNKKPG